MASEIRPKPSITQDANLISSTNQDQAHKAVTAQLQELANNTEAAVTQLQTYTSVVRDRNLRDIDSAEEFTSSLARDIRSSDPESLAGNLNAAKVGALLKS